MKPLGGATTHSEVSGIADYKAKDDQDALYRIRSLIEKIGENTKSGFNRVNSIPPVKNAEEIFEILPNDKSQPYDTYEIIERIVDKGSIDEYKAAYGENTYYDIRPN